jgi:lactoylglutathione lyase
MVFLRFPIQAQDVGALDDNELAAEIRLLGEVMAAVASIDRPLTGVEVDGALGVAALPLRSPQRDRAMTTDEFGVRRGSVPARDRTENDTMSDKRQARITSVHTVGVPVTDQDRALEFYVGTLGFDKLTDAPVEQLGGRWIVVAPAGSATTLALVPANPATPAGVPTGIRLSTNDARALHEALTSQGVETGELLVWPGVPPMFAIKDPDHNGLSVSEVS